MGDHEQALVYHRQELNHLSSFHPDRSKHLNAMARILFTRFNQLGKTEDLEEAITYNRQSLVLHPPGHPRHSTSLSHLASTLTTRFRQLGKIEDLEEAIAYNRQTLIFCPPGHPLHCTSLDHLVSTLSIRFRQLGKMEDLEEAVIYSRQALFLLSPGHPGHSVFLNSLVSILFTRFKELGRMEDLEEVITYGHQGLNLCPFGHPIYSTILSKLAESLSTRFEQMGKMEDLEDAIIYCHQLLILCPPNHPAHPSALNNLANSLMLRFRHLGKIGDLMEAFTYNCQALTLCPPSHPAYFGILNNIANTLSVRFNHLGKMDDLEGAIKYNRQALVLVPPGHPFHSSSINNLAISLCTRFDQLGKMEDLEEAIMYYRQALICPPGHPSHPGIFNNLAGALFTRFKQLGNVKDLEEAIVYHYQVISLWPLGHTAHSGALNNLADTLASRFNLLGKMEDLEEAVMCYHQSLDLCPPGHPERPMSLYGLANALSTRFDQIGKMEDLEETIRYLSEADISLPTEHPLHVMIKSGLASNYLKKYNHSPTSDHYLSMAFTLFESAVNHPTGSFIAHFTVALNWATIAQQRQHKSTIHAYFKAFSFLARCLILNPTMELQHKFLAMSVPKSIASDAASGAIEVGQIETAIELLDQGRAILWSKIEGYRHPLEQLRQVNKELADQFETLSMQLENHAMSSDIGSIPIVSNRPDHGLSTSFEARMQVYRILSEEWDEVVGRIRQIDGFADFLCTIPFNTLQSAAAEGPVIIVNVSKYRSDAIILHHVDSPVLVPLSQTLPQILGHLSSQIMEAQALEPIDSSKRIISILRKLWDHVVFPVTKQLALLGVAEKSRIWWCPTSMLCTLPLHAAGPYLLNQKCLPDIYISSYTPTLSSLIKARSGIVCQSSIPKLLIVGLPGNDIPKVEEELHQIQKFGVFVNILVGQDANHTTVLSSLQQHSWAHFACHGHQHIKPFQSSFLLHNNDCITILDFIKAQLPNAELAFLSACHSAAGDKFGTPDEVIHLAAALQFSGFKSVIGTLWAMADTDGPDIAKDFYAYMFRQQRSIVDFRDSAMALNISTRKMRRKRGMTVDRWINFVHIGA